MYSLNNRANSVFMYFIMCLTLLMAFNIATTIFDKSEPVLNNFELTNWAYLYNNTYTKIEHTNAYFNLDIDFTPIINWNTNLVFFWISATYKTGKTNEMINTATVYDGIIRRNDDIKKYHWTVKNILFEYPLTDIHYTLKNKVVEYQLNWEHMPVCGPILKYSILLSNYTISGNSSKPENIENIKKEYGYYRIGKLRPTKKKK